MTRAARGRSKLGGVYAHRSPRVPSHVAPLGLRLAFAAALSLFAPAAGRAAPMPVDSLATETLRYMKIAAPDITSLSWLRRQADYAAKQFGNRIGNDPPLITLAAIASLPESRRPSVAVLRVAGYEHVLAERADKVGEPPVETPENAVAWVPSGSERIARWYMEAFLRQKASTGVVIPDWFASAISGFAAAPAEQNRRVAWMHARLDQRIPLETFFEMKRPEAAAPKPAAGKARPAKPVAAAAPSQRLYDAQALSFARFMAATESERFIGKVLERQLQGEPRSSAFNIAKRMLPRADALEKDWLAWVKAGETIPAAP